MPKSPRYRELEIRDKIIKCLQEDDFIKTKIERINLDTKEKDYFIYKLPFTKKTINSSYALSVFFLGERTLLDNYSNISLKSGKIYISIFYQDADLVKAIDEAYKFAIDIEYTLENNKGETGNLYVQDIYPARPPELEKSLYTYVLIMELGLTGNLSY